MQKPIDLVVKDTKDELLEVLNKSGLPITVMHYIVADVLNIVGSQANASVSQIREQYERIQRETQEVKAE